ncbi:MAG: GNAT family N-acetyltransferase [Methylococcales bacterium]
MIEAITAQNLDEVLPLIRQYQIFYKVAEIDDQNNKRFFSQFDEETDKGCLFAYRKEGKLLGFATVYFSYSSTITAKVAVLNDLYTVENARCQGIGTALIKYCEAYGKSKGAARLQWVTAPDNTVAQTVYKSLGAKQSSWELFTYVS